MDGPPIWWMEEGVIVAATAAALLFGLWLQRAQAQATGEAARETARLSARAAELQTQSIQSAHAAIEAAHG